MVNNLPIMQETWVRSILRLGRSPGRGHGNRLQYSCLENPKDGGAWPATVHGVAKSWTWLSDWACTHTHTHTRTHTHTWSVLLPRKSEDDSGQWSEGLTVQPSSLPQPPIPSRDLGFPPTLDPFFSTCVSFKDCIPQPSALLSSQQVGGWIVVSCDWGCVQVLVATLS